MNLEIRHTDAEWTSVLEDVDDYETEEGGVRVYRGEYGMPYTGYEVVGEIDG